jgi:hypothetical protein
MKRAGTLSLAGLLTAATLALIAIPSGPAKAQMACRVALEIVKGGFIVGAAGGSGTLTCGNKSYPLDVGGIKAGLLIGISKANLRGPVRNLRRVQDIAGTYAGGGAGITVGGGVNAVVIVNQNGVELVLSGTQVGLEGNLDLSGTVIRLR